MPQLPKRNTLDFAPDSIISASKKMSVVQSSQMKDATEMDAIVRPIKNENDTKREMGRFTNIIGEIGDIFNRIRSLGSTQGFKELTQWVVNDLEEGAGRRHLSRLYGGADPSEEGLSAMEGLFNNPKKPRAPRKKKDPVVKKLIVDKESEEDEEVDKATVAKADPVPEAKVDPVPEAKADVKSNKFIDWSKYSAELSEEEDE